MSGALCDRSEDNKITWRHISIDARICWCIQCERLEIVDLTVVEQEGGPSEEKEDVIRFVAAKLSAFGRLLETWLPLLRKISSSHAFTQTHIKERETSPPSVALALSLSLSLADTVQQRGVSFQSPIDYKSLNSRQDTNINGAVFTAVHHPGSLCTQQPTFEDVINRHMYTCLAWSAYKSTPSLLAFIQIQYILWKFQHHITCKLLSSINSNYDKSLLRKI